LFGEKACMSSGQYDNCINIFAKGTRDLAKAVAMTNALDDRLSAPQGWGRVEIANKALRDGLITYDEYELVVVGLGIRYDWIGMRAAAKVRH
jgi:hypothetical protein